MSKYIAHILDAHIPIKQIEMPFSLETLNKTVARGVAEDLHNVFFVSVIKR